MPSASLPRRTAQASASLRSFSVACATFDRRHHPARGRAGGETGRVGRVALASGKVLPGKETYVVPAGDRLVAEMPGGGGYGKT